MIGVDVAGPFPLAMRADDVAAAMRNIVDDVLPNAPRRDRTWWMAGLLLRREWGSIELLRHQWRNGHFFMERHLDSETVRRLCNDPRLRQQLAARLGDDLVLWRSEIWLSRPGESLIPRWHHDAYPMLLRGEGRSINAYIALTDVEPGNGFEYLPASLQAGPRLETIHVDRYSGNAFLRVPPDLEQSAVPVRLNAGEFVLFDDDLVHRSVRNTSGKTRVSLTLRVATPTFRIRRGYSSTFAPLAL